MPAAQKLVSITPAEQGWKATKVVLQAQGGAAADAPQVTVNQTGADVRATITPTRTGMVKWEATFTSGG